VGVAIDRAHVEAREGERARFHPIVVTGDAVLLEEPGVRSGCWSLRADRRAARQDRRGPEPKGVHCFVSLPSSAMVDGLATGELVARKTPSAQAVGVRPSLSFTSRLAPRLASSSITSSEPRLAAPWTAASPIWFTALTSNPRSRQSLTAS